MDSDNLDTALVYASANGEIDKVTILLAMGARVDAREQGFTPILVAAQLGHKEVCELLLATGKADVKETTPDGCTPLLKAAEKGHTEVCELLLTNGSDLEERKPGILDTALHCAAINGHQSLLDLLLSHKADVNSRNRIGFTPLHYASQDGHLASVPERPQNPKLSGQQRSTRKNFLDKVRGTVSCKNLKNVSLPLNSMFLRMI